MTLDRCKGQNKDGTPCTAYKTTGRAFCPWHDPERAEEREGWRRKGGVSSSKRSRARKSIGDLRNLVVVQSTLLQTLEDLKNGTVEPAIATAMATVARALVAVAGVNSAVAFEEQLESMARQITELQERRGA